MLDRVNFVEALLQIARPLAAGLPADNTSACAASLTDAGMTSMGAVKLMLAIEAKFAIEIPEAELTPQNFASVESVARLAARLGAV